MGPGCPCIKPYALPESSCLTWMRYFGLCSNPNPDGVLSADFLCHDSHTKQVPSRGNSVARSSAQEQNSSNVRSRCCSRGLWLSFPRKSWLWYVATTSNNRGAMRCPHHRSAWLPWSVLALTNLDPDGHPNNPKGMTKVTKACVTVLNLSMIERGLDKTF